MIKYTVAIPEMHYAQIEIEADSPEEAFKIAFNGEYDINEIELVYSHTILPKDKAWEVLEAGLSIIDSIDREPFYVNAKNYEKLIKD